MQLMTVSELMDKPTLAVLTHVWLQVYSAAPHPTPAVRKLLNADFPDTYRVPLNFILDPLT